MSDKPIEEKVKDIIVEQLGVNPEQVTPNASFIEDLGADSLDIVELVMAFEEEFSVEVPDEDAEKLQTVGDVVKYIEDKAEQAGITAPLRAARISSATQNTASAVFFVSPFADDFSREKINRVNIPWLKRTRSLISRVTTSRSSASSAFVGLIALGLIVAKFLQRQLRAAVPQPLQARQQLRRDHHHDPESGRARLLLRQRDQRVSVFPSPGAAPAARHLDQPAPNLPPRRPAGPRLLDFIAHQAISF